jgi:hypothetical protein
VSRNARHRVAAAAVCIAARVSAGWHIIGWVWLIIWRRLDIDWLAHVEVYNVKTAVAV